MYYGGGDRNMNPIHVEKDIGRLMEWKGLVSG